jgi:hypothetical protein
MTMMVGCSMPLLVSVHPRQLDRRFVGLTAGVAEEHLVHTRQRGKAIGRGLGFADTIDIGSMDEAGNLIAQRLDQAGVIVTQRVYGDSRQGVEVGLALFIEQPATLSVGKGDRQPPVGIHQMRHESAPR